MHFYKKFHSLCDITVQTVLTLVKLKGSMVFALFKSVVKIANWMKVHVLVVNPIEMRNYWIYLCMFFSGVLIDCGADVGSVNNGLEWLPDSGYISAGSSKFIAREGLVQTLFTVRSFPLSNNVFKKFCYEIPVDRTKKYLVRTTYYYGGVNGNANPPVFDQIVDGTLWRVVNTTEDFLSGESSYYEGVFMPTGKNLSVCVAGNTYTDSDPFISALEVVPLWDQLYNSTDFRAHALSLVARHSFGYDGPVFG